MKMFTMLVVTIAIAGHASVRKRFERKPRAVAECNGAESVKPRAVE